MKRFITFGHIEKFNDAKVKLHKYLTYKEGRDVELPVVSVNLSEKIHGTSAGVCYSNPDGFWVQSRTRIITPEKDNAACAFMCSNNKDVWISLIRNLAKIADVNLDTHIISLYSEFCGGNIQAKTAVSGLDKRFIIFKHFKVSPIVPELNEEGLDTQVGVYWKDTHGVDYPSAGIYNIMNLAFWNMDIDFEHPAESINKLIKLVEETVEPDSPVGNKFGIKDNIGEGVVGTFMYDDRLYRFKVKGDKHSNSKVRKLKVVDEAIEAKKAEFANTVCTPGRLEQAWVNTFGIANENIEPNVRYTGDFLRNVFKDVLKEELEYLGSLNLEPKAVNSNIAKIARRWFMQELDRGIL